VDRAIAARARRQHGVIARAQLAALGLSRDAIDHRVAVGRLHVVHRGVYAVGHTLLTRSARWMAAVLACGPDAALSHASAAALWAMQRGEPTIIDVTTNRSGRKRPGLRIHRPRHPAATARAAARRSRQTIACHT
jgi:predicted transcriptional regulator of viral defense system